MALDTSKLKAAKTQREIDAAIEEILIASETSLGQVRSSIAYAHNLKQQVLVIQNGFGNNTDELYLEAQNITHAVTAIINSLGALYQNLQASQQA